MLPQGYIPHPLPVQQGYAQYPQQMNEPMYQPLQGYPQQPQYYQPQQPQYTPQEYQPQQVPQQPQYSEQMYAPPQYYQPQTISSAPVISDTAVSPLPVVTTALPMVLDQDTTKRLIMAKRYCVACLIPGVIIFLVLCAVEIICMGFVIRHEYVDNKNTTNKGFKGSSEWIALVIFSSITGAFYLIYMALIGIGIAITPPGLENFKPNATPVAGSESVTTPTAAFMETSDSDIYVVKKYKQFIPTRTKLFFYFLFILFLPLIIVAIVVITAVLILAASGGGGGGNCGNCGSCDCCNNTNRRPAQGAPAPAAVV